MNNRLFRWRPLTTGLLIGGTLLILVASAFSYVISSFEPKTEARLGSGVFHLRVANDEPARVRGLSGVEKLGKTEGLLMVFDTNDKHGIWMKDMQLPLDIIWLDISKVIIHVVSNAQPENPAKTVYNPKKPARYVIELPAGVTRQYGIKVGQTATFDESKVSLWL